MFDTIPAPPPVHHPSVVATCRVCERRHQLWQWEELPYVGVQSDEVETTELRNCVCGSTIGRGVAS